MGETTGQKRDRLAIVVPCYNEEAVLLETSKRLTALLRSLIGAEEIASDSFVLFVNDGSRDQMPSAVQYRTCSSVNNL